MGHECKGQQGVWPNLGNCDLLMSAYILAGLAMMLNIRLSYSSAPYALIRFKLPENLFSVFVRRMASALELWCLPSMLLGNIMDLIQKLGGGGHQVRALKHAKGYDIQSTNIVPEGLKKKATQLQSLATSLKTKAGTSEVNTTAGDLSTKAQTLSGAASELSGDGKLTDLKTLAQALAKAAKDNTGRETSLYKAADELKNAPNDHIKAMAVIEVFDKVKSAYEKLANKAKEIEKGSERKVKAVETQYQGVKAQFEKLCMALIKEFAGQVETNAQQLAGTRPNTTHANSVVEGFDVVASAFEALNDKATVSREYYAVKLIYERILNLTKLAKAAEALSAQAGGTLSGEAGTLAQRVTDLRDKTGIDAQTVKSHFETVVTEYNKPSTDKNKVSGPFQALKGVYENIGFCYKDNKFGWIIVPSILCQWLNFLTYVILLIVYVMGGDHGNVTVFYFVIAISGVVFGINMTLVYSVDFYYIPVYIAGENSFPIITSAIHYIATLMFGNRRKWNSDFLLVEIDIWVAIIISFVAAVVWTYGYVCEGTDDLGDMKHIHAHGFAGKLDWHQISPFLMIVVGMGLVYAIYPGIAPGMIVPFYLVDKIEMVLLIATFFPPVIIAILRKHKQEYSPANFAMGQAHKWTQYEAGYFYLSLSILMVIKIFLAYIFIYSLHYRDSNLSRSIVNQPKMSTFLSITFYMCHEILLALGFSGFIGNEGGDYVLIPQYIGALFMIFLAFYSEGYIIEYKSHDPAHWPTTAM